MYIQSNIMAMNVHGNYSKNQKKLSKSAEKLASGFSINRSADDAAGLAISEKMRTQIRGLTRASLNSQDGISLVQTAEGALQEVHNILQRINELSVQAASDINVKLDRDSIQTEIDQLLGEIDQMSTSVRFNTIPLLSVDSTVKIGNGSNPVVAMDQKISVVNKNGLSTNRYGTEIDFSGINEKNIETMIGKEFHATCTQNCYQVFDFKFTDGTSTTVNVTSDAKPSTYIEIGIKNPNLKNGTDLVNEIMNAVNQFQNTPPFDTYSTSYITVGHANGIASSGAKLQLFSLTALTPPNFQPGMGLVNATKLIEKEHTILIQTGAEEGHTTPITIRTVNRGTLDLNGLSVSDNAKAGNAITKTREAINFVSEYRAEMGAVQNRFEHKIQNLDNTVQNLQASESQIRDVDMAKEMSNFTKTNILIQAATSMLVQANSRPQNVLSLLQ